MQWWSLLALADLFVINRPHTQMNSFPQYQIALWFYLRDYVTTWASADFEEFVPSSSAVRAVEAEEEETGVPSLRRAGSVCGKGHTRFTDSD